jgi:redox-sensing transcriptional repressor
MLYNFGIAGNTNVYSHQIAGFCGVTPAQVRRDLMSVGYSGSPNRGYNVQALIKSIGDFLDEPHGQPVALIGVGNLGRAILAYFAGRRPKLSIVAAFDVVPERINRAIHGCRCYHVNSFPEVAKREGISVGIITTPADTSQAIADTMVDNGVRGILNFAPLSLKVPPSVYVVDMDMITALETVAYFARQSEEYIARVPEDDTVESSASEPVVESEKVSGHPQSGSANP